MPIALTVIGLGVIAITRDNSGVVIGVLVTNAGLAVWAAGLMGKLLRGHEPRRSRPPAPPAAPAPAAPAATPCLQHFAAARPRPASHVREGDYVSAERALYRVEAVRGSRVLLEECRTGDLYDMEADECARLENVRRGAA